MEVSALTLSQVIQTILRTPYIQYPLAGICIIFGALTIIYLAYSIYKSYKEAKETGKKISWLKILEDIKWTLYSYSEVDKEYVMSLPRLMYFVSMLLIIYVVFADKTTMLTPLLGFNVSAMAAYTSKKYIEVKGHSLTNSDLTNEEVEKEVRDEDLNVFTSVAEKISDINDKLNI
jgi:uncharacterized membrane protein